MKKQASPVPIPRAAALSQSASRYAAGAASAWQNIADNSARLADANRRASGPGYAPLAPGQPAPPDDNQHRLTGPARATLSPGQQPEPEETIRQVGWREVEQAVSVSTKRKYNFFGIGFGPKVPVFETEKVKLPVYQETDRNKRYYAVVQAKNIDQIKREGFQVEASDKRAAPMTIGQFNSRGSICFFSNEANAYDYGQKNNGNGYVMVEFTVPEYQEFTADAKSVFEAVKADKKWAIRASQKVPADCIRRIKAMN
jgi:hypothetical protein